MTAQRPIILLVGPTAGGKTALAIEFARNLPGGGECIGADSMQVYRGMDIGTAKPTPRQRAAVPHHLLDVADPALDGFTVDTWLELAEAAIAEVRGRGHWPIVVGGTNLYVQALLHGLDEVPPPDPALRDELAALDDDALRAALLAADPAAAERIHRRDRRRTIRALEVHRTTGRPLSASQRSWSAPPGRDDLLLVGLDLPVEATNRRINARVRAMVEAGLVEEVRALDAAGRLGPQAREALGYKQVLAHLRGEFELADAIEQTKIRTRRFAKQQRTWLRRFRADPRARWILLTGEETPQEIASTALRLVADTVPEAGVAARFDGNRDAGT